MLLIKNILKPLAKSVLIPLVLTAAAAVATDSAIYENAFGYGHMALIISNEEMNDIMRIIKSFEKLALLIKGVRKTIKNEAKNNKESFSKCY